jgi:hypothetical protein
MAKYKRNQIEEAISRVLAPKSSRPTPTLLTRVKRLLETDRMIGDALSRDYPSLARYAFFSAEAEGSGVEVWFSDYEAFALLIGIELMAHRWPQRFAVSVMRSVRHELEQEHAWILEQDQKRLFDPVEIRRNAKEGDFASGTTDPVLLVIVSDAGSELSEGTEPPAVAVRRGAKAAFEFARETPGRRAAMSMVELTVPAHNLLRELALTRPRRRGRTGCIRRLRRD